MCGENRGVEALKVWVWGSPPRVQGKLGYYEKDKLSDRITPACAGKTNSRSFVIYFSRDHPRVCGENLFQLSPGI